MAAHPPGCPCTARSDHGPTTTKIISGKILAGRRKESVCLEDSAVLDERENGWRWARRLHAQLFGRDFELEQL